MKRMQHVNDKGVSASEEASRDPGARRARGRMLSHDAPEAACSPTARPRPHFLLPTPHLPSLRAGCVFLGSTKICDIFLTFVKYLIMLRVIL